MKALCGRCGTISVRRVFLGTTCIRPSAASAARGPNRIEEGFVITGDGAQPLSPFVRSCCGNRIARGRKSIIPCKRGG
jgi:hypothetical protein